MRHFFICFFLLFSCSFLNGFSAEPAPIENSGSSIQTIIDTKVYLKPGTIQIAKNGIFINVEGELVPIDHLEMDNEGVYFELQRMKMELCEKCGVPLVWGKCINPICKKKKKE